MKILPILQQPVSDLNFERNDISILCNALEWILENNPIPEEPIAPISRDDGSILQEPDGLCICLLMYLTYYCPELKTNDDYRAICRIEKLFRLYLDPYIPEERVYLPKRKIMTQQRIDICKYTLCSLQTQLLTITLNPNYAPITNTDR